MGKKIKPQENIEKIEWEDKLKKENLVRTLEISRNETLGIGKVMDENLYKHLAETED